MTEEDNLNEIKRLAADYQNKKEIVDSMGLINIPSDEAARIQLAIDRAVAEREKVIAKRALDAAIYK